MAARTAEVYDRVAPLYDLTGSLWDRTLGRAALRCVRAQVREHVRPGARVLDLGAGTGRSLALLLEEARPGRVVGIDRSAGMLSRARVGLVDSRVALVQGDARRLPFADETFDVVTSVWMLETLPDPLAAVREGLRVLRPGGVVLVAFSALPTKPTRRILAALIGCVVGPGFAGRFLAEDERPLHGCGLPCARRYDHGLAAVAIFGKRCQSSIRSG